MEVVIEADEIARIAIGAYVQTCDVAGYRDIVRIGHFTSGARAREARVLGGQALKWNTIAVAPAETKAGAMAIEALTNLALEKVW